MVDVPKISVAMATYNGAAYLEEQLNSLAEQDLPPAELQIGDDGSTDGTDEIVRDFAARARFPVHFHKNRRSLGYGENFIRTALRCRAQWIAFCDQDDVWHRQKLLRCADEIAGSPGSLDLIVHDAELVDGQLQPFGRLYNFRAPETRPPQAMPPEWYCLGLTQVFNARLLREIASDRRVSFPWHHHREAHDVWVALLANMVGTVRILPETLVKYRRHDGAVSAPGPEEGGSSSLLTSHGQEYFSRADYLGDVAAALARCRDEGPMSLRSGFDRAAARVAEQAELLRLRGTAYQEPGLRRRLDAYFDLAFRGGYIGGRGWPFGLARCAKDLLYVLAGPSRATAA